METRSTWQIIGHRGEKRLPATERLWGWPVLLIALWTLLLLYMPFVERTWGEGVFYTSISLSVLIQCGIVLFLLVRGTGIRRTFVMAVTVILLTWAVEAIGTATNFPFGPYIYTERLQPQFLDVPLLIPLAWMMMLPPAWVVARRLSGAWSGAKFVNFSALAFAAWDLFLDPQMVKWNLWVWEGSGLYFGIPLINFAGWIVAAALITLIARPVNLPERPLLLIYSLTWIMETAGLIIFWELYGPALFGFVAMGIFVFLAHYSKRVT